MKVFSVKKFEEISKIEGYSTGSIERSKTLWANECEGLTEEEINKKKLIVKDDWMIEKFRSTITLKEFWDSKKKLAIHCWNEKQANILLKKFDEMGKKWFGGNSYLSNNYWNAYAEKTCYLNCETFGKIDVETKKTSDKIYEFKDIEDFKGIYAADGTALGSESKQQSEKEQILDEVEKKYLSAVIKPFRDRIKYIKKIDGLEGYFIFFKLKDNDYFNFPYFNSHSSMYKGMEKNKEHTLEELGL